MRPGFLSDEDSVCWQKKLWPWSHRVVVIFYCVYLQKGRQVARLSTSVPSNTATGCRCRLVEQFI
jgi:hypothetical protein